MMDYPTLKNLLLSFWSRYAVSWIAKALAAWAGYDAATSQDTASKVTAAVGVLLAVILDVWHSRASHRAQTAAEGR